MSSKKLPLILLDVDGVVNICDTIDEPACEKDLKTDWKDIREVAVGDMNGHYNAVKYSPTVVQRINSWVDRSLAEVMWLTSWRSRAKGCLAPALGLRDFKVPPCDKYHYCNEFALDELCEEPGRPVVWIDDELSRFGLYGNADLLSTFEEAALPFWYESRPQLLLIAPPAQGPPEGN